MNHSASQVPQNRLIEPHESSRVFLFAVLVNFAVQLVFGLVTEFFLEKLSPVRQTTVGLVGSLLIQCALLGVYLWFVPHKNLTPRYRLKKRVSPAAVALCAALGVFLLTALFLPTIWVDKLLALAGVTANTLVFDPLNIVIGVFVLVIGAPIVEELLFRGALLSGLTRNSSVVKAVLFAALAFALSHFSPSQTFYQFFVGAVSGFAAVFTGSLVAGIVCHAVSNLAVFVIGLTPLDGRLANMTEYLSARPGIAVLSTIGVLVAAGGVVVSILYVLWRKRKTEPVPESESADSPPESVAAKKRAERIFYFGACAAAAVIWLTVLVAGSL